MRGGESHEKTTVAYQGDQAGSGEKPPGSMAPTAAHECRLLLLTVAFFIGLPGNHIQISSVDWFYSS
jgi:hypothetical protein